MAHASTSSTTIRLHMTRRFEASAERLYEAWVSPDQIKKWLFTQEATNKIARNELYIGESGRLQTIVRVRIIRQQVNILSLIHPSASYSPSRCPSSAIRWTQLLWSSSPRNPAVR